MNAQTALTAPLPSSPSWEQDYEDRVNPQLMTGLLRTAIPVLEHSNWYIDKVEEGFFQSVLPLNSPTTNQHGTHQAALISLSADYTGGLALATLLRGIPLAGVHRCHEDNSASLWLASMNVKYRSPSSGHLTGVCRIDPKKAEAIRSRYFSGNRISATLEVEFFSNSELVAVAEMKYFAQPTSQLTPAPSSKNSSPLFSHKLKASARMIVRSVRILTTSNDRHVPSMNLHHWPHDEQNVETCNQPVDPLERSEFRRLCPRHFRICNRPDQSVDGRSRHSRSSGIDGSIVLEPGFNFRTAGRRNQFWTGRSVA